MITAITWIAVAVIVWHAAALLVIDLLIGGPER